MTSTNGEALEISSERVDDIPVILAWLDQMKIATWIDESLVRPHGNHQGLSYGQLSVLLLTYIISQADHRLCAVEGWMNRHRQVLERSTQLSIGDKDVSDDRLARVVEELGLQSKACDEIDVKLGQHLIRAYELPTDVARIDTSSYSVHHEQQSDESRSLLRQGHSKDHRPDLLQYRQMLGTLDPAGVPLVSATIPGNGADDPVYLPTWEKMVQVLGHSQFIVIADCKARAIKTRAQIASKGGFYCFPLSMSGQTPDLLKQWVLNPPTEIMDIDLSHPAVMDEVQVRGFEMTLGKFWQNPETQQWIVWDERHLVVFSQKLADAAIRGQTERLEKAQIALAKLAAKPGEDLEHLNQRVETIQKRYRTRELLNVTTTAETFTETRYIRRGRPTPESPTEQIERRRLQLVVQVQSEAIEQFKQLAGWRLYVTNTISTQMTLTQGVTYYRDEWTLERAFHRFKRGRLPALPIYFQNQNRIIGLMFLLTIALRVFTLMEFVVRLAIQNTQDSLSGLYEGNPKRATARPSAEQMLKAFTNLTIYFLPSSQVFITPLSDLQRQILVLMKLPDSIYRLDLKRGKT